MTANSMIVQEVELAHTDKEKIVKLWKVLQSGNKDHKKFIVFCRTKHTVTSMVRRMSDEAWTRKFQCNIQGIQGNMAQNARNSTLEWFKTKSSYVSILFATDVASRGLDVKDIDVVINFDMP